MFSLVSLFCTITDLCLMIVIQNYHNTSKYTYAYLCMCNFMYVKSCFLVLFGYVLCMCVYDTV